MIISRLLKRLFLMLTVAGLLVYQGCSGGCSDKQSQSGVAVETAVVKAALIPTAVPGSTAQCGRS